jgi:hypothetical protein
MQEMQDNLDFFLQMEHYQLMKCKQNLQQKYRLMEKVFAK